MTSKFNDKESPTNRGSVATLMQISKPSTSLSINPDNYDEDEEGEGEINRNQVGSHKNELLN